MGVSPLVNTGDIKIPDGRVLLAGSKTPRVFNLLSETGGEFAYESKIALVPGASFNIELVSGNKMHLQATVNNYSYDADITGSALIKAKDLVVRYGDDPWTVNALALDRLVGGGDVTLRAERNLTVEGKPSVIFLSGSILSRGEPAPHGTLVLSAGNDLRLKALDISGLRTVELLAGNDIDISSFTATGYDSFYFNGGPRSCLLGLV